MGICIHVRLVTIISKIDCSSRSLITTPFIPFSISTHGSRSKRHLHKCITAHKYRVTYLKKGFDKQKLQLISAGRHVSVKATLENLTWMKEFLKGARKEKLIQDHDAKHHAHR